MNLKKILYWAIVIKLVLALIACFVGFTHPHILRQFATMNISMRYAIDWSHATHVGIFENFVPRTLAEGDKNGIVSMEFPILNWLSAPIFMMNMEQGRNLSRVFLTLLVFGLWWVNLKIWRTKKIANISMEIPALLIFLNPIMGLFLNRFIPDEISAYLCFISLGLCWDENPSKKNQLTAFLLSTVGLLMKPTSVIAFAPYLLQKINLKTLLQKTWLALAIIISALYYTKGVHYLQAISELDPYFKTWLNGPLDSIKSFFAEPKKIGELFMSDLFSPFFLIFLVIGFLWKVKPLRRFSFLVSLSQLAVVLGAQIAVIVLLDGGHSLIHHYYYVGATFVACAFIGLALEYFSESRAMMYWVLVPMFAFNLEHSFYDLRPYWQAEATHQQTLWQNCEKLKQRHQDWPWNKAYAFRSILGPITELGTCFGEIQGSQKSQFGFYREDEQFSQDCHVIDKEGIVQLVECAKQN